MIDYREAEIRQTLAEARHAERTGWAWLGLFLALAAAAGAAATDRSPLPIPPTQGATVLPIETTGVYIPGTYTSRGTGREVRALRVTEQNLKHAGRWTGRGTWVRSVVVPTVDNEGRTGETLAEIGDWIVSDGRRFHVSNDATFRATWSPA